MSIKIFSRVFKMNKSYISTRFMSSAILLEEKIKVGYYNINYVKVGTGPHALLCLPGVLGTIWTDFKAQVEGFDRNKFTLVAWDLPGYGNSRPPEKDYTLDFYERDADYIYHFMKALKFESYSLLGWSAGAVAGAIHAAKYPDATRKLVIWGTISLVSPRELEKFKIMTNMDNWSENNLQPMLEVYGQDFIKHFTKWSNAMIDIYNKKNGNIFLGLLPAVKCPTLILHGRHDPFIDEFHVALINTLIPGSRTHTYPEGKHNIHIKYAEDFNMRVQDFLLQ